MRGENEGQSGFLGPRCSKSDVRIQNDSDPSIEGNKVRILHNQFLRVVDLVIREVATKLIPASFKDS